MLKLADLLATQAPVRQAPRQAPRAAARQVGMFETTLDTDALLGMANGPGRRIRGREVRVQGLGYRVGGYGGLRIVLDGRTEWQGPASRAAAWLGNQFGGRR